MGEIMNVDDLMKIVKEIDIGKYTQTEYREVIDEILVHWKAQQYDIIYEKAGWRDVGGQS